MPLSPGSRLRLNLFHATFGRQLPGADFDHFGGREGGQCFRFPVEVSPAHAYFFTDHVYIQVGIGEISLDNSRVLFQELFVKRGCLYT